MAIVLALMVKNESRILERCVRSVGGVVDDLVVVDTGSDDATLEIARMLGAKVSQHTWMNFGHNRTQSFQAAKELAPDCEWVLVLDADMKLVCPDPAKLHGYIHSHREAAGFSLLQVNGASEYRNIRVMRLDQPWTCKGVTHEYWACRSGVVENIPRELAWIDDVGDGGAKADKFERDERMLRDDLKTDPANERSFFYLANTLQCEGKLEEAAEWYKRRVDAGGWEQERYFSAYQLALVYDKLQKPIESEYWAMKACEFDPERNESLLFLVGRLRDRGEHYKAWHYLTKADRPKPEDKLFLQTECYEDRAAYERSIIHYYISPDRDQGMRHLIEALPKYPGVLVNTRFYAAQLPAERERKHFPEPPGFWAGSVAVNREGVACVRTADYYIEDNGGWYRWRGDKVTTRNFRSRYDPETRAFSGFDEIHNPAPLRDAEVVGLEDVRLVGDMFTATQKQWTPEGSDNLMAVGTFEDMQFTVAKSPRNACEKNWLLLPDRRLIYSWHPLVVGQLDGDTLRYHESHTTPRWWTHLRGSAPATRVGDAWIALTHIVVPKAPRDYFSVLVQLRPPAWEPVAYSLPFYFIAPGVEYCLSLQAYGDEVHFFVSRMDRESYVVVAETQQILAMLSEKP